MAQRKRKTGRTRPTGPGAVKGSEEAMKLAVAILETLSGITSPTEAREGLGISVNRYYQLETRALQGVVTALEPRPRGRTLTPERERDRLKAEKERLERELLRYQALARTAQKTIGLAKKGQGKGGSTKRRSRRPRVRAKAVLKTLKTRTGETSEAPESAEAKT